MNKLQARPLFFSLTINASPMVTACVENFIKQIINDFTFSQTKLNEWS